MEWYEIAWYVLPFLGLLIWGALSVSKNMWYDELYSASLVSNDFWRMLRITAADAHSPFYYAGLKIFYMIFGQQFWALKLYSLVFMMAYLMLGMFPVKRLFGQKVSVYFMFFSITMPIMCVQGANVRMYALALFFLTLTSITAYDIYLEPTRKKWIIFCLASVCSVYCHTFAMIQTLFIYIFFFGALIWAKQYQKIKGFFICGITVAVLYFPWMLVTLYQMKTRLVVNAAADQITEYIFIDYCKEWFSALETPIPFVMFTGMGMAIFLGYYAVDYIRAHKNYAPGLGVLAIGLTSLTGALLSVYVNPCFLGRYAFPGFGALALFYAVGMEQIRSKKLKTAVVVLVLACFVLQYRSELKLEYDSELQSYEDFFEEKVGENDVLIAARAHEAMLSVYHPDQQYYIYGYKPYILPFKNLESYTDWSQLENVEGNIWYICFAGDEPDEMAERYTYENVLNFHHMYYDFAIYRLDHK